MAFTNQAQKLNVLANCNKFNAFLIMKTLKMVIITMITKQKKLY